MNFTKKLLISATTSLVIANGAQALGFLDLEVGGLAGVDISNAVSVNSQFSYGGYARLWLFDGITFAPYIKYETVVSNAGSRASLSVDTNGQASIVPQINLDKYYNLQYGLLVGYKIPIISLTPYVGVGYSQLGNTTLENTYVLNYGIKWEIPLIPFLTIGVDGSWQASKTPPTLDTIRNISQSANINRVSATIGLQF